MLRRPALRVVRPIGDTDHVAGDIDDYLTWLRAAGASPHTVRLRRYYLRRLAAASDRDLFALGLDDLALFLSRSGWGPETRKSARAAVRGLYGWAHETGRIAVNPARLLPAVRVPAGHPRPAPDDVFGGALSGASDRDRLMLLLAGLAGLRRAEIAAVHSRDVIGTDLRVTGKGGRVRHVPLHPDLATALAALPAGWVFPGRIDGHLSAGHVGVTLKRLLGPGWSGHTLRHRFASRAYAVDRDLRAVQELLGHSKPETTARYTAIPNGALRSAVMGAG